MSKQTIYNRLIAAGMTPHGACGLMGNMQAESGLLSNNAQNGSTSLSDEAYTSMTDSGAYQNFCADSVGYGLCQWTSKGRKTNLLAYAKRTGRSIGDETMQVDFCILEIQVDYPSLWKLLCTTTSIYNATYKVCVGYERPKENNVSVRNQYAQNIYNELNTVTPVVTTQVAQASSVGYDVNKVIATAEAEVGYIEKKSNASLDDKTANRGANNYTKYARDLDNIQGFYNGKKQGCAYCDCFVDWCFVQAYGVEAAMHLLCQPANSAGAGCQYSAQYYRNKSQFYTSNPQVGDQIFFGSAGSCNHTGLVYAVDSSKVYTIEGNVNGTNGEGVYKKSYPLGSGAIYGYGRPKYGTAQTVGMAQTVVQTAAQNITMPTLSLGSKGEAVQVLQLTLIAKGYPCGNNGADGDFGANTRSALLKYQKNNGLTADGICGQKTWEKLLKG